MDSDKRAFVQVLVADGSTRTRRATLRGLLDRGYCIDVAFDGEQAWALMCNNAYDIVILRLSLPGLNVLETLRLMRRLKPHPFTVVVGSTRNSAVCRMALRLGADVCLKRTMDIWRLADIGDIPQGEDDGLRFAA